MSNKFDAANKHLLDTYPADWVAMAGLPAGSSVQIIDTDLSTVSTAADKMIRVDARQPYIAHFEPQAGARDDLDQDILVYTALAWKRWRLPVLSVALLLRPAALNSSATGQINLKWSADHELKFAYKIVRVWELSVKSLLDGGVGTLPLAPISDVKKEELPQVIDVMKQRLDREVSTEESREIWTATKVLMGLRYSRDLAGILLKGVIDMEESTTYMEIIEKGIERGMQRGLERGRLDEARATLLRLGVKRLGNPSPQIESILQAIGEVAKLEALTDRLIDTPASSWESLLQS